MKACTFLCIFLVVLAVGLPRSAVALVAGSSACPSIPIPKGYLYFPYVDYSESPPICDIGNVGALDVATLAQKCNDAQAPLCMAFNTNGWLKKYYRPQSTWYKWTADPCQGFYVRSNVGCLEVEPSRDGLAQTARSIAESGMTIIYSTSATRRWQFYTDRVCYTNLPKFADTTSFVAWLYWQGFGYQPDNLNGKDWKDGSTGTLWNNGASVAIAAVKPGDLVFYGDPKKSAPGSAYVGIYVDDGEVAILTRSGPVQLVPLTASGKVEGKKFYGIRTYKKFLGL